MFLLKATSYYLKAPACRGGLSFCGKSGFWGASEKFNRALRAFGTARVAGRSGGERVCGFCRGWLGSRFCLCLLIFCLLSGIFIDFVNGFLVLIQPSNAMKRPINDRLLLKMI